MDSKINPLALNILGIQNHANSLIELIQSPEGLGLNEEQKAEFKKKIEEQGVLEKLKKNMDDLKELIKKANSNGKSN